MAIQRTFSIIKPDATKRNLTGKIVAKFEEAGLRVVASKRIHLTLAQAQTFYGVHKDRPFFGELCWEQASQRKLEPPFVPPVAPSPAAG